MAKNYDSAVRGFEKPDYSCEGWDDIRVPAHIQMEGYRCAPVLQNTQYPWEGREDIPPRRRSPEYFNPVASYVKYFTVPERMKGKTSVYFVRGGRERPCPVAERNICSDTAATVLHLSQFELTAYVKDGLNKLAVQVFKWTARKLVRGSGFLPLFRNIQAMFIFLRFRMSISGICRSVRCRTRR